MSQRRSDESTPLPVVVGRWLRRSYLPTAPDAEAWTPPEGTWDRVRPTLDGLFILVLVTVPTVWVAWVFVVGTTCQGICDSGRLTLGGLLAAALPLASTAAIVLVTFVRATRGKRPVRLWLLGIALVGGWFAMGLAVMDSAFPRA